MSDSGDSGDPTTTPPAETTVPPATPAPTTEPPELDDPVVEGEDDPTSTTGPPAPTARTLVDRGIQVVLPPGWEGEIYRRAPGEVAFDDAVPRDRRQQPTTRSVVHLGSFPLPPDRGDYGSGAVEIMRDDDVLVILFEFEPESATEAMFAHDGLPRRLEPDDFGPQQMQRPLEGMAGVQRFFNVDQQRSFCLFVVIGSDADRKRLVARVNSVLRDVTITA